MGMELEMQSRVARNGEKQSRQSIRRVGPVTLHGVVDAARVGGCEAPGRMPVRELTGS